MSDDHEHAGPSFQMYLYVFYALCVFTALSFVFNYLAHEDVHVISHMSSVTAIVVVAIIKASLVAAIFMHLKFDSRLYARLFLMGIAFALTLYLIVLLIFGVFS